MAQVVLGAVGGALGGGVGAVIGAALGRAADNAAVAALSPPRQRGPRLETLRLQSSADGSPMACVFGRARVTGQIIWAARFLERRHTQGGGKGGPKTVEHAYSLSFAVALGEGPIDGIGRIWADGQPLDLREVTMRVHRGTEDQSPDPLIEAVEGRAPAYRGTAYVVFEDLPLGRFGNRPPQLSFEVFRRPRGPQPGLEERLEGVCLIPGAGEFVLASEVVVRRVSLTRFASENMHTGEGRPDLLVSLDQLQAQAPNLKRVNLIVGWFGDDLRAGRCRIMPGVERRRKPTEVLEWEVAGIIREGAHLISDAGGAPAYGGTPSDQTVIQAVRELKARGLEVVLYPFVFMDIPANNNRPPPTGDAVRQPPYPWRGRIVGREGDDAAADVAAIFGGPWDWGLRRQALHYAHLAVRAGADGLLIGSEMRGLTRTRDAEGGYPAVAALKAVAAECRAIVGPDRSLSYAADWSEYFGDQRQGDARFHLDPLWADPDIDYVGIDWYPPMTDWRGGDGGLDAGEWRGATQAAYLAARVAGGEGFDWHYASDSDRMAQIRTPTIDTAHGEDWVFRPKDLKGWWLNPHHDRIGGVRSEAPTAWIPGMKPIRLVEFGCAAVDRGANSPNLFQDPKSSESHLPPHSTGARDDLMQRRALEAVLNHFASPLNNPVSPVYGGPMVEGADAWCWDARPFPAFPALGDVWADAGAWNAGHWLNGRLGGEATHLIAAVLKRGGLEDEDFVIEGIEGAVSGYVIDRPMSVRAALEPLLMALDAVGAERDGRVAVLGADAATGGVVDETRLALPERGGGAVSADRTQEPTPGAARVRFIDEAADYQTGSVTLRGGGTGGAVEADLPIVCGSGLARGTAGRMLGRGGPREALTAALDPLTALRIEPGDGLVLSARPGRWRVTRIDRDETPSARLEPWAETVREGDPIDWRPGPSAPVAGRPLLRLLDLPTPPGRETDARAVAAVASEPWRAMTVHAGPTRTTLTPRGEIASPATVGRLVRPLDGEGWPGRWDWSRSLSVDFEGRSPQSAAPLAVLGGANALAVETADGWEIVQFQHAELQEDGAWRLSGLLRGQSGTDVEMRAGAAEGALVVRLDTTVAVEIGRAERGLDLMVAAGPAGAPPGGATFAEANFPWRGLEARPWSPARLRIGAEPGGRRIRWTPRLRRHGDDWEVEPPLADPLRFQVEIADGDAVRRVLEVDGVELFYSDAMMTEDFGGAPGPGAQVRVAQAGADFGWGATAVRVVS